MKQFLIITLVAVSLTGCAMTPEEAAQSRRMSQALMGYSQQTQPQQQQPSNCVVVDVGNGIHDVRCN